MPLPVPEPALVQAPADAGVGLVFNYHWRLPAPWWPADWWQRNFDLLVTEYDEPGPPPLTERMMHLPPPPEVPA